MSVALLASCSVSTVAGPIWSERRIVGEAPATACVAAFDVTIAGTNPWLEQVVRRQWLEALTNRQGRCAANAGVRVDVSQVTTTLAVDAYGSPGDGKAESTPPPARQQLTTTAVVTVSRCRDGEPFQKSLRASGWLPYTADSFAAEERAAALLTELVRAEADQLDLLLAHGECLYAVAAPLSAAMTAPTGTTAANDD